MVYSIRLGAILGFLLGVPLLALSGARPLGPTVRSSGDGPLATETSASRGASQAALSARAAPQHDQVSPAQEAWFQSARQQLRRLGAVYLRLERWNSDRPVYQFRCDLRRDLRREPGDAQITIQVFSGSARAATDRVLQRAHAWHRPG